MLGKILAGILADELLMDVVSLVVMGSERVCPIFISKIALGEYFCSISAEDSCFSIRETNAADF